MAKNEYSLFAPKLSSYRTAPSGPTRSAAAHRSRRPHWTLEDPVLPCRQAGEDLGFHGLRPDEAQVGLHAGETVGREAATLFEEHPDLIIPVDIVEREGDEAKLLACSASSASPILPCTLPDPKARPGSAIAAVSGHGSSGRGRNSSPRARWSEADGYRPASSRSACRSGRPRIRVPPACRRSRNLARPASPGCAR